MYFLPPPLSRRLWRVRATILLRSLGFPIGPVRAAFAEVDDVLTPVMREVHGTIAAEQAEQATGHMAYNIGVEVLYVAARLMRPRRIVETGVAAGTSSAAWLTALARNGDEGQLVSIDLPKRAEGDATPGYTYIPPERDSGWAIPDRLRDRHELLLGPSSELLPDVLARGQAEIFFHDSDHSEQNMRFEFGAAWPAIPPGGLLVSHDVHKHAAFDAFARAHGARHGKAMITGLARKPR